MAHQSYSCHGKWYVNHGSLPRTSRHSVFARPNKSTGSPNKPSDTPSKSPRRRMYVLKSDCGNNKRHKNQPGNQYCLIRCSPGKGLWHAPRLQELCQQLENFFRCPTRPEYRPQCQLEHPGLAADGIWLPTGALTSIVAIETSLAKGSVMVAREVVDVHVVLPLPTPIALGPTERAHGKAPREKGRRAPRKRGGDAQSSVMTAG